MGDILIFQRNWEIERVGVVKKTVKRSEFECCSEERSFRGFRA
jgi:hypothetical protein